MTTLSTLEDIKAELITTYHDFYVSDTNDGLFLSRGIALTIGIRGDAVATYQLGYDSSTCYGFRLNHDEGRRWLEWDRAACQHFQDTVKPALMEVAQRMNSVDYTPEPERSQPGLISFTSMTDFVSQFGSEGQSFETLEIIQAALHRFESRQRFRLEGRNHYVIHYDDSQNISRMDSKVKSPARARYGRCCAEEKVELCSSEQNAVFESWTGAKKAGRHMCDAEVSSYALLSVDVVASAVHQRGQ